MVKVGDRVRRKISFGMEGGTLLPDEEGVVWYVHPEGRFYSVRFTFPDGYGGTRSFSESYPGEKYDAPEYRPQSVPRLPGHYHGRAGGSVAQDAPPATGHYAEYLGKTKNGGTT